MKVNYYRELPEKGEEVHVLEFPELTHVNLNDLDVQKEIIRHGLGVGMPGGDIIFRKKVRLDAGASEDV